MLTAKEVEIITQKVRNASEVFFFSKETGDTKQAEFQHQYILGMVAVLDSIGYEVTYNGRDVAIMKVE